MVDERSLPGFIPQEKELPETRKVRLKPQVAEVIHMIQSAKRPIIFTGNGIHIAKAEDLLIDAIDKLQIPVTVAHTAKDVVHEDHPLFQGVVSPNGQRRANFAIQNSDLVISIASGISATKVGFNYKNFAPQAKKIIVDLDEGQTFHQAISPDLGIVSDAKLFLEELMGQLEEIKIVPNVHWIDICKIWKERYPVIIEEYFQNKQHVNSYVFVDRLSDLLLTSQDTIVAGAGLTSVSHYQAFKAKLHQRSMTSGNWGAMGWDLPLSIGACIANGKRRTICITGDGSVQWNIQELETIRFNNLPIKIFIFNNAGFGSIRATQRNLFNGHFTGAHPESGVGNPNFAVIAQAYGLGYSQIRNNEELIDGLQRALSGNEPSICEVNISPDQAITPKASSFRRPDGTLRITPLGGYGSLLARVKRCMKICICLIIRSSRVEMKALVVGLGSIGRRHLANLTKLVPDAEVTVLRRYEQTTNVSDQSIQTGRVVYSIDDALPAGPELAIIATPAPFHIQTGLDLARHGISLLIEKPFSDSMTGTSSCSICAAAMV